MTRRRRGGGGGGVSDDESYTILKIIFLQLKKKTFINVGHTFYLSFVN
jgi:hypothetical protein